MSDVILRLVLVVTCVMVVAATTAWAAQPLAFPGAEGFGALTTGGRGGEVYHVTNLNDSGAGSLRDAVSGPNRIVVFDVGGIIKLESQITVSDNITIAGQSAPGGITLYGRGLSFSERNNIIVRYLRLRSSINAGRGSKTLNVSGGSNMIFDHLSISWGRWDDLGFTQQSHDITLQNCIIGEAIDPQRFGALIDSSDKISVVRNLWINNQSRNPKGKANMQYINNVVYNWGSGGYCGGHSAAVWKQDLIGNYFIKGPSTSGGALVQFATTDHLYMAGNLVDLDCDGTLNGREVADGELKSMRDDSGSPTLQPAVQNEPPVPVTILSAAEAYERILTDAGASMHRDVHDLRMLDHLRSLGKSGEVIKTEETVGGIGEAPTSAAAPTVDSDRDGMPDAWENEHGLNANDSADGKAVDATTGYTNLELYLHSLVPKL